VRTVCHAWNSSLARTTSGRYVFPVLRQDVFRSGTPAIIAAIGVVVFLYVAALRRERLAGNWATAWALLLARYVWNGYADQSALVPDFIAATLRIGFAGTVLAGVWALRGRPRPTWAIVFTALAVPAVSFSARWLTGSPTVTSSILLASQAALLATAAWWLSQTTTLPAIERCITAGALALYTAASTVAPRLPNGSPIFSVTMLGIWALLLLVSFGLFAIFFRLANDAELAAGRTTTRQLTDALGEFVAVCMHCKAVRDEQERWQPLEKFVTERRSTKLSHGLCPQCAHTHYGELQPG
jgi:hypothetical protein